VLDSLHLAAQAGIDEERPRDIRVEQAILDHVEKIRQEPDQGIWESRGPPRQFTYSKAMAWVAADRFVKLAEGRWESGEHRRRIVMPRDAIHGVSPNIVCVASA
jgi:GH15 family glucan-1,4-alpha-glucosidase